VRSCPSVVAYPLATACPLATTCPLAIAFPLVVACPSVLAFQSVNLSFLELASFLMGNFEIISSYLFFKSLHVQSFITQQIDLLT
tara:strand:- start:1440 stop:1694 length:255 start_codon:yes stop_codon:yes gene_type:complete